MAAQGAGYGHELEWQRSERKTLATGLRCGFSPKSPEAGSLVPSTSHCCLLARHSYCTLLGTKHSKCCKSPQYVHRAILALNSLPRVRHKARRECKRISGTHCADTPRADWPSTYYRTAKERRVCGGCLGRRWSKGGVDTVCLSSLLHGPEIHIARELMTAGDVTLT